MDIDFAASPNRKLEQFLISHEKDIALSENDFGELSDVFFDIIGRDPCHEELSGLEMAKNEIWIELRDMICGYEGVSKIGLNWSRPWLNLQNNISSILDKRWNT